MTRVLIVDDKPENVYLLRTLLQGNGCIVDAARHGAEALTSARRTPPDLIVSDLLMPVMDGYTATRAIREWESRSALKPTPIIALTAHAMAGEREKALEVGCNDFETKPVDLPKLLEKINTLLGQKAR